MIDVLPTSWKDLQNRVAQILNECGLETDVEKQVDLARGRAEIDVWAHDARSTPPQTYIIECKQWSAPVPQNVVHAFRSVVGDCGANWGAIVSSNGFQSGAYEAAKYSNVQLLTWREFQALFASAWFERHFCCKVAESCDPLIEYTEPINSRIFRKADLLSDIQRKEFKRLREVHLPFAAFCMMIKAQSIGVRQMVFGCSASAMPEIPLRNNIQNGAALLDGGFRESILDAATYRELMSAIIEQAETAIASFDQLFGERA
jgi:restriction system protein